MQISQQMFSSEAEENTAPFYFLLPGFGCQLLGRNYCN